MAGTGVGSALLFYSTLSFSMSTLSRCSAGEAGCNKESTDDTVEPSIECVPLGHSSNTESYIIINVRHVALFSHRGKQQYNCKCNLQGFSYTGFGPIRFFSTVAEKHVNNYRIA